MKAYHIIDSAKVLHLVEATDKDTAREIVNRRPLERNADVFFDAEMCKHGEYLPPVCPEWMEYVVVDGSRLCKICSSSYIYGRATTVFRRSEKEIKERELDLL